nr:hypothetical protein [Candidatus Baldrarchaeota archaeon]
MIHAVVLVKADTGEYLLDRKYGKIDVDGALLSGVIAALKSFIGEIIEGEIIKAKKELEEIKLKGYRIVFERSPHTYIAIIADYRDDEKEIKKALNKVLEKFEEKYGNMMDRWTREVSELGPFYEVLDEILMNGKVGEIAPLAEKSSLNLAEQFGLLKPETLKVAKLCNGTKTIIEIAEQLGIPESIVRKQIEELIKMKIVKLTYPK